MKIILDHVSYIYNPGTANEKKAVKDVSLTIYEGEFIALAGSTGSGKSTLVQLINGLKLPSSGSILYNGESIGTDKKALRNLRCRIGLVFQYPEYQLFDETVLKDVSFGPKNQGYDQETAEAKARTALEKVGLGEETYTRSPFDLSGGEKRRAAIAGMIAMEPEVLILDEPTAGLDPKGKKSILEMIREYHRSKEGTVIMISHNMDEAAEYADRIIVMDHGHVIMDDKTHNVFRQADELEKAGLSLPQAADLCNKLGITGVVTIDEAVDAIYRHFNP